MTDFLFLGSKITVDVDWSHEIRRQLLLGRKAIANIDNVLKSRDITLLTNVHIVKAMVFPMVMYGCDSWTVKKVECQRSDAFKLWCWIRLLKVPWKARRSNQLILREINPEYQSLEGLMLKLKLIWSDFGHLIRTDNSLEKSLMLGKIKAEGEEVSKDKMAGWHYQCNEHELGQTLEDGEGRGGLVCYSAWGHKESDMTEQLNNNYMAYWFHTTGKTRMCSYKSQRKVLLFLIGWNCISWPFLTHECFQACYHA